VMSLQDLRDEIMNGPKKKRSEKSQNIWDYWKSENEASYDGYCLHKDCVFIVGKQICRTCKTEWEWDSKTYSEKREPVKWPV
jgi:hypothetical protein